MVCEYSRAVNGCILAKMRHRNLSRRFDKLQGRCKGEPQFKFHFLMARHMGGKKKMKSGEEKYPHIFSPGKIGEFETKNRIKYASTETKFNYQEERYVARRRDRRQRRPSALLRAVNLSNGR